MSTIHPDTSYKSTVFIKGKQKIGNIFKIGAGKQGTKCLKRAV